MSRAGARNQNLKGGPDSGFTQKAGVDRKRIGSGPLLKYIPAVAVLVPGQVWHNLLLGAGPLARSHVPLSL